MQELYRCYQLQPYFLHIINSIVNLPHGLDLLAQGFALWHFRYYLNALAMFEYISVSEKVHIFDEVWMIKMLGCVELLKCVGKC